MLHVFISIIGILITIFFVIGTHEFAHFYTARLLGVKVLRFSIGFGKTLYRRVDKKGTEYVLALIPLGGYVKMLDENEGFVSPQEKQLAYNTQPYYKKFLIVLAGPLTNIFCALILYWMIFMIGFTTIKPIIGNVVPQSIAALGGLKTNQEIIQVDDKNTRDWAGFVLRLVLHAGDQDTIQITTTNEKNNVDKHSLNLKTWHLDGLTPDPLTSIGIIPFINKGPLLKWPQKYLRKIQYTPLPALAQAGKQLYNFTYFNFVLMGKLISGKLSLQSLGGPITIFDTAGNALNLGLIAFLGFLAFLSISIGVINLLPIPGLDGGHLFLQTIEWIIRRPVPEKILNNLYRLGFLILFFVLLVSLINDVLRLNV
jgi:regulator of sigma E protease